MLQDHLKTKVLGKLSHGLYYVDISPFIPSLHSTTCVATKYSKSNKSTINLAKLWHLRLRHLSLSQLKVLIPDIDVNKFNDTIFCTICSAADRDFYFLQ